MDLPRSRKRKRGKQTPSASSQGGGLTQLAGRFGSVNVHEEMEEMEEKYSQLSEHAQNRILCNVPRQSDFSAIFNMDPGQFVRGVSGPTPDLSPPSADLYQSNATAVADERIHQYSLIPLEDNDLEEPLSQPRLQSRTEARSSLASNPQLSVDGTNAEPVGLVANTSVVSLDLGNREQAGSVLALEGSTFHDDLLSPDWLRRDRANSVLPFPDWSFGFGFSTS